MIRQSESITALCAALVAAQAEMPSVPKATKGQVGNATRFYADLSAVLEVVQPVLARHDLGFVQFPHGGTQGSVTVVTRLFHKSGEWMECEASMPTGGQGAQAVGSATTYQKRYSLMAVLGLATEDDDGKAASAPPPRQPRQATPAAAPRPAEPGQRGTVSDAQIKAMGAAFTGAGIRDRDARIGIISQVVLRSVSSSQELSKEEAGKVIDYVSNMSAHNDGASS